MKKVINSKLYDTKTASRIGITNNLGGSISSCTDFHYVELSLYKTKLGRYFKVREPYLGDDEFTVLTMQEALEFAAENFAVEDFEEEFSELIEEA